MNISIPGVGCLDGNRALRAISAVFREIRCARNCYHIRGSGAGTCDFNREDTSRDLAIRNCDRGAIVDSACCRSITGKDRDPAPDVGLEI
jgi:hypothetical protein